MEAVKSDVVNYVDVNKKYFDEQRLDVISRALTLLVTGAATKCPEIDFKETYVAISNTENDRVLIELKQR